MLKTRIGLFLSFFLLVAPHHPLNAAEDVPVLRAQQLPNSFITTPGSVTPLTVAAVRADGSGVPGLTIAFDAPKSGPGGFFPDSTETQQTSIRVETDANGRAVANFQASDPPGLFLVTGRLDQNVAGASFAFTTIPAPPAAPLDPTDLKTAVEAWVRNQGETVGLTSRVHGPVLAPAGSVLASARPEPGCSTGGPGRAGARLVGPVGGRLYLRGLPSRGPADRDPGGRDRPQRHDLGGRTHDKLVAQGPPTRRDAAFAHASDRSANRARRGDCRPASSQRSTGCGEPMRHHHQRPQHGRRATRRHQLHDLSAPTQDGAEGVSLNGGDTGIRQARLGVDHQEEARGADQRRRRGRLHQDLPGHLRPRRGALRRGRHSRTQGRSAERGADRPFVQDAGRRGTAVMGTS